MTLQADKNNCPNRLDLLQFERQFLKTAECKEFVMAYLELHDIHKSYFLGKEEFPVLKGINLEFERGEFVSILGESGGG